MTLRDKLYDHFVAELHGPVNGPDEEVAEQHVVSRYLLGLLAPLETGRNDAQQHSVTEDVQNGANVSPALDVCEQGRDDDLSAVQDESTDDGGDDSAVAIKEALIPSSLGMSFTVDRTESEILVTAEWGRYEKQASESRISEKSKKPLRAWKRIPCGGGWKPLLLKAGPVQPFAVDPSEPDVIVQGRVVEYHGDWIVTLFLVNMQEAMGNLYKDDLWLFQVSLKVKSAGERPAFVKRSSRQQQQYMDVQDKLERENMEMLYRDRVEFAVGHGTSVHASVAVGDPTRAVSIETTALPRHEAPARIAPGADAYTEFSGLQLDMAVLADPVKLDDASLIAALQPLATAYEAWIERQRECVDAAVSRLDEHRDAAGTALDECTEALRRIREGIGVLNGDAQAREAFRFANRAMHLQRVRSIHTQELRRSGSASITEIDIPANRTWYPFQLAFILMNLPGLADLAHPDRCGGIKAHADLLWFPTGGGKTEAYLGLAAFTMAMRRLQGIVEGRDGRHGVAVLMRYTLRLLTLQQYQRAAALICACETIRREDVERWGEEPFRLGLWVGRRTTPNDTAESHEAVMQLRGVAGYVTAHAGLGSPHQVTHCPWCGRVIAGGKDIEVESYAKGRARTIIYCGDPLGACPFSRKQSPGEGLPLLLVDDEIYRRLPDLLIATVDKFAQMPWNGRVQMLFGRVDGRCPRHGFRSPEIHDADMHRVAGPHPAVRSTPHPLLRPPDLIIQDELHLISGPLGTLVGLYETAVDELASWECNGRRVRPKVIASTATVRRAPEQVQQVFARSLRIFPPSGLDAEDNFFSRESPDRPGRLYAGVCAPGFRLKSVLIRVYTALLSASQKLYEEYGAAADPWMTLAGYFNSLRELGGMRRLVDDDVRSRLWNMEEHGLGRRGALRVEELTSRIDAVDIPHILDLLETGFDPAKDAQRKREKQAGRAPTNPRPVDVLLATNMLSVGVDIGRLGLMVVAGQPKSTSEYIQATSRIGRRHPGLVLTVLNWARPRDMSHYETFEHYHQSFYRHVETLSVTPYSARALDRGLTAVLVSLIRLAGVEFNPNDSAAALDLIHPIVEAAKKAIESRAGLVTADNAVQAAVLKEIKQRLDAWHSTAEKKNAAGAQLGYRSGKENVVNLLWRPGDGGPRQFTCLQSLRDVEEEANLVLYSSDAGGYEGKGVS
jgi:Lhr-like helicase